MLLAIRSAEYSKFIRQANGAATYTSWDFILVLLEWQCYTSVPVISKANEPGQMNLHA